MPSESLKFENWVIRALALKKVEIAAEWKDFQVGMEGSASKVL